MARHADGNDLTQIPHHLLPPNWHAADAHAIAADEGGERSNWLAVQQFVDVLRGRNRHPVVDEQMLLTRCARADRANKRHWQGTTAGQHGWRCSGK